MAAEQLQIQVQANVQQAIAGLNLFNSQLDATAKASESLGATSLNILNNQLLRLQRIAANPNLSTEQYQRLASLINKTSKETDNLSKSIQVLNRSNGTLTGGANQANTAMINLGRTVSDAPFGFIGIANNIGPLVENFTFLRKEAGSSGGALKQLGASLIGPGGLIVGIQLAVAAIQFAQLGLSRWGAKSKEAKQKQDELSGSIAQQYTQVLLLASAYERDKSLEGRKEILSQLNTISSEYFGNLKAEQTSIENLKKSYDGYIQNLLQSFAVKQLEADLEPLIKQLAVAQSTVKKIGPDLQKLGLVKDITGLTGAELEKAIKYNQELQDGFTKLNDQQRKTLSTSGIFKYNQAINESNKLWNQINQLINNASVLYSNSTKQTQTGKSKEKSLQEQINELLKKYLKDIEGINWDEQNRGLDGTKERLDTALEALKEITLKGVNPTADSFKFLTSEVERFRAALDYKNFRDNLERINKETKAQGAIRSQLDAELQKSLDNATRKINTQIELEKAFDKLREKPAKKQIDLQTQYAGILTNEVGGAIDNMFNAFERGDDIFQSLGDSLNQLVINIAKAVVKMLVLKAIANAIAPGSGAAVGAASESFSVRGDYLRNAIFA
jgi:Mn-dependent DtxR family transcriptional regulator